MGVRQPGPRPLTYSRSFCLDCGLLALPLSLRLLSTLAFRSSGTPHRQWVPFGLLMLLMLQQTGKRTSGPAAEYAHPRVFSSTQAYNHCTVPDCPLDFLVWAVDSRVISANVDLVVT
jgi:hypothetical protein